MKIRIETEVYDGSPAEIMEQLWEDSFDKDQFPDLGGYIDYMAESFERMTELPCKLPEGTLEERAHFVLMRLQEIDALEVILDE